MSFAVIRLQAHQYVLKPGDTVEVLGTLGQVGDSVSLGEVLMVENGKLEIGQPVIKGDCHFEVVSHSKSSKIKVFKYKSKSRYRKTQGHRDQVTTLKLIAAGGLAVEKSSTSKSTKSTESKSATTSKTDVKKATKPVATTSTKADLSSTVASKATVSAKPASDKPKKSSKTTAKPAAKPAKSSTTS